MTELKEKTPNQKQQECIDNIYGKYLVLAGPGTGKTFTVIQRIKNILNNKIDPKKILCLTFSDTAAKEMKERLNKEIKNINDINIYTYHSFCLNLIEQYGHYFDLSDNIKIIKDTTSRALLKECIDEFKPKYLKNSKNDPYACIEDILRKINEIKRNRLTKENFEFNLKYNEDWYPKLNKLKEKIEEKHAKGNYKTITDEKKVLELEENIQKTKELWELYEFYQSKMDKYHFIDFNDMISLVLDKFETSQIFLEEVAKQYEFVLVDEYQDTNKSQNEIVFHLSSNCENIFVVGDDDQIVYSFQGAKLDTIEKYLTNFPDTKVICLDENMRSTQNILDVSRELTKQDDKRLEINPKFEKYNISKNLISKNENIKTKEKKVKFTKYQNILQEYNEIINKIEEIINSPDCPKDKNGNKNLSEIAILTRSNKELETFSQMLKERNIPSELKEGKSIFEIKSSLVLFYYLKALCNIDLYSDKLYKLLLNKPFSINPKDYEIIFKQKTNHKSIIDCIKEAKEEFIEKEKIENFIKTFEYLKEYKNSENLKNIILETGAKTGIFNYYLNCEINKTENIAGIKKFIDEALDYSEIYNTATLEDFIEYLDISIEDDIEIKTNKAPMPLNAIQLSTYHSAKGREYDFVFMPTLTDTKWEKNRNSTKATIPLNPDEYKNEDELKEEKISQSIKVMYVGMTRARHSLYLSYPIDKTPSDFIVKLQNLLEIKEMPTLTIEEFWQDIKKTIIKRDYDYKKDFNNFITSMLNNRAYSATALNTYLNCPRQYLYDKILELSAKDTNPNALSYGSAIHSALEYAINFAIKNKKYPDKSDFIDYFKNELKKLTMSSIEQKEIHLKRGEIALEQYFNQMITTPIEWLYSVEKQFIFELDNVKFTGFVDRIDCINNEFIIYDYKTGKAKSKNSIAPDKDYENYYNQMAFYKFALEKTTNKKVKSTTFIFPEEPNKNVTLDFSDEEINKVIEKYKNAIKDIQEFNFEPIENENKCQYCQYRDFCKLDII